MSKILSKMSHNNWKYDFTVLLVYQKISQRFLLLARYYTHAMFLPEFWIRSPTNLASYSFSKTISFYPKIQIRFLVISKVDFLQLNSIYCAHKIQIQRNILLRARLPVDITDNFIAHCCRQFSFFFLIISLNLEIQWAVSTHGFHYPHEFKESITFLLQLNDHIWICVFFFSIKCEFNGFTLWKSTKIMKCVLQIHNWTYFHLK